MVSLAYILLTGWMGIVQCCNIVPSLVSFIGKIEKRVFILSCKIPKVFAGRGGVTTLLPTMRGGAPIPGGLLISNCFKLLYKIQLRNLDQTYAPT